MRELEKIAEELFDKLRSRFNGLNLGDENAKHTSDPEQARFFNFDYHDDAGKYGNVTISIIDGTGLKIYFGKNISRKMDQDSRKHWFEFLKNIRYFAKRNLMTFDTRDITRSSLGKKDVTQASKSDGVYTSMEITTESRLYGTPKTSFENIGSARIRIIHSESVDPEVRGSRARHIHSIYVENAMGERFMLEHNKLSGARAMARHISEGGIPYDEVGQHINSMVAEMSDLGRFVRVMKRRTFEDTTARTMVEAAGDYYTNLNKQLNHLQGARAYHAFVENFQPQKEQLDEVDVNELKEKFVKKIFDDRMMAALPHVYKAYQLHEQTKQKQLESVRSVVRNQTPLQLSVNEGMDEYFQALSFGDPKELVIRVLEDIAQRSQARPEIAEFAAHWAKNFNTVNEQSDQTIKEHQALAVQLVTRYLKDLKEVRLNPDLRIAESDQYLELPTLFEGSWSMPDTPQKLDQLKQLMAQELPVGMDAENATGQLYDLLGSDQLFDALHDLSQIEGSKADARDVIKKYIKDELPDLAEKLGLDAELEVQPDATAAQTPDATAAQPAAPAAAPAPAATPAPQPAAESMDWLARLAGLRR
jgi:hypothetical protein